MEQHLWRLGPCQSKPQLVTGPSSRHFLPSVTTRAMLISVLSTWKRWPCVGPGSWPPSPQMQGARLLGTKIHMPHSIPCMVRGHCISVLAHQIPTPRGTVIIWASSPKKLLRMTGMEGQRLHCHLGQLCQGHLLCHFQDLQQSHPNTSKGTILTKFPYQEFTDLVKIHMRVSMQKTQAWALATTWCFYTRKVKWMH